MTTDPIKGINEQRSDLFQIGSPLVHHKKTIFRVNNQNNTIYRIVSKLSYDSFFIHK